MLEGMIGSAFELVGVQLHERLTPGDNTCWLPMPGEREMVAGALGRLASRHMPAGVGAANDLGDAIMAGVGVVLYGINNAVRTYWGRRGQARAAVEYAEAGYAEEPGAGEEPAPPDAPPPRDPLMGL